MPPAPASYAWQQRRRHKYNRRQSCLQSRLHPVCFGSDLGPHGKDPTYWPNPVTRNEYLLSGIILWTTMKMKFITARKIRQMFPRVLLMTTMFGAGLFSSKILFTQNTCVGTYHLSMFLSFVMCYYRPLRWSNRKFPLYTLTRYC